MPSTKLPPPASQPTIQREKKRRAIGRPNQQSHARMPKWRIANQRAGNLAVSSELAIDAKRETLVMKVVSSLQTWHGASRRGVELSGRPTYGIECEVRRSFSYVLRSRRSCKGKENEVLWAEEMYFVLVLADRRESFIFPSFRYHSSLCSRPLKWEGGCPW
ncbi:hypothetical protein DL98DRAFT_314853 [Cadophora sp. DSE1049]|nr:hypothetical protein DL98DRAFT_314853 [Cadophora sp. DSE1049]